MKVFAIPTIASGLTAAFSVLFFTGLSQVMGDDLLGRVILVQSAVAVVSMICVPQCWVYLIASKNHEDLVSRYRIGFSVEIVGIVTGALVVGLIAALPFGETLKDGLIIYASIAVQASSSCLGWLRATESWKRYLLWILIPNLVRVPLIWTSPWFVTQGWLPDARGNPAMVMLIYFLVPDLIRWLGIAVPIAISNYKLPRLIHVASAVRIILKNWLFDAGSAITDMADKVVVGTLLGPEILVSYFFARRLGIIATMVCEPFYAENFRRALKISNISTRLKNQTKIYLQGLSLALALFIAMSILVTLATHLPVVEGLVPNAVALTLSLFFSILLVDCLLAANRWSRFIAEINGGSFSLLSMRIGLFALFSINVWIFGDAFAGLGLAVAFGLSWLAEACFVLIMLRSKAKINLRT